MISQNIHFRMFWVAKTKATMFSPPVLIRMKDAKGDGSLEMHSEERTNPSATSNAVSAKKLGCPPMRRSSSNRPAKIASSIFTQLISG